MNRRKALGPTPFFVLFALCCLLPFIAAKLALSLSLFSPGVNNKGDWLEQDVRLPVTQGLWQLLYVQAGNCDNACELTLYSLQQLHAGLGSKSEGVGVGVIAAQAPRQLEQYPLLRWQAFTDVMPASLGGQLLLVNRQGQVLLHYGEITNQQDAIATAKKMRADLLRLLAFDRPVAVNQQPLLQGRTQ